MKTVVQIFRPGRVARRIWLGCALLIAVFALLHLAGLRENVSVLSGTVGSADENPTLSALLGTVYVLFYVAAVLVAPVLALAAAFLE